MTTKNVVIVFIILVLGILVGRCSAPHPPHELPPMEGAVISSAARDCVLDNMSTANTDRAFDFLVSDCNRQAGKARGQ